MNTLGLGTIISLYVSATAAGSDLRLINLGKRIHRSFHADVRSPKLDVDRAARGLFAGALFDGGIFNRWNIGDLHRQQFRCGAFFLEPACVMELAPVDYLVGIHLMGARNHFHRRHTWAHGLFHHLPSFQLCCSTALSAASSRMRLPVSLFEDSVHPTLTKFQRDARLKPLSA